MAPIMGPLWGAQRLQSVRSSSLSCSSFADQLRARPPNQLLQPTDSATQGFLAQHEGHFQEALAHLQKAIADPEIHYGLAMLLWNNRRPQDARQEFRASLNYSPEPGRTPRNPDERRKRAEPLRK
jgi:Flp pilus assembly protein TadD